MRPSSTFLPVILMMGFAVHVAAQSVPSLTISVSDKTVRRLPFATVFVNGARKRTKVDGQLQLSPIALGRHRAVASHRQVRNRRGLVLSSPPRTARLTTRTPNRSMTLRINGVMTGDSSPPDISDIKPANVPEIPEGTTVEFELNASDPESRIAQVEAVLNGKTLGVQELEEAETCVCTWPSRVLPLGTYTVQYAVWNYVGAMSTMSRTFQVVSPPQTGKIVGKVTDQANSSPLSGVRVTVNNLPFTTDATGIYRYEDLPAGSYIVTAEKSGYDTGSKSVTVTAGGTANGDIVLARTPPPIGGIAGKVTDSATGTGISSATVDVKNDVTGAVTAVTTDTGGNYSIQGLATVAHTVTASKAGYASLSKPATVTDNQTTTVDFALVANPTSGSIAGLVTDAITMAGVKDARIEIRKSSDNSLVASATTDATGNYSISSIATGTYRVVASAYGYADKVSADSVVTAGQTTTVNLALDLLPRVTLAIDNTRIITGIPDPYGLSVDPASNELVIAQDGLLVYNAQTGVFIQKILIGMTPRFVAHDRLATIKRLLAAAFGNSKIITTTVEQGPTLGFQSLSSAPGKPIVGVTSTELLVFVDGKLTRTVINATTGGNRAVTEDETYVFVTSHFTNTLTRLNRSNPSDATQVKKINLGYEPGEILHIPGTQTIVVAEGFGRRLHLYDRLTLEEMGQLDLPVNHGGIRGLAADWVHGVLYIAAQGPTDADSKVYFYTIRTQ